MKRLLLTTIFFVAALLTNLAGASNTSTDTVFQPQTILAACDQFLWNVNDQIFFANGKDTIIKDTVFRNDTLYTLNLNLKHTWISRIDNQTACNSYDWRGKHLTTSRLIFDTVHSVSGLICDSIYKLNLTIHNSNSGDTSATACESFFWNGDSRTTSGDYTKTISNVHGCDSVVTLHLVINRNSSSNFDTTVCDSYTWPLNHQLYTTNITDSYRLDNSKGCDSIVTLNLTIHYSNSGVDYQHGCDTFAWGGISYTEQGTYNHVFTNQYLCDSTVTLFLSIDHGTTAIDNVSACDNYTWIDGLSYTTNNDDAVWVIPNRKGCDSTITLNLTINHNSNSIVRDTVCDAMVWNGIQYTQTGAYSHHYISQEGCPSVDTLFLTVKNGSAGADWQTACDSYTWIDGMVYTSNNNVATHTLANQNAVGCDSTVTLHLVINHSKVHTETISACDSLTWHGNLYSGSATDTYLTQTTEGCDSTIVLNLTINHSSKNIERDTVCDGMDWNGTRYTETGEYNYHYLSAEGCPSVDSLFLLVYHSNSVIDSQVACDRFVWMDTITYVSSTDTTITLKNVFECDSLVTLHLIVNYNTSKIYFDTACDNYLWDMSAETYYNSGVYAWDYYTADGCPSVDSLYLTIHNDVTETRWNDVITINNKTSVGELSNCQWYHNGEYVGNKNYYREVGGLSGSYYVVATGSKGETIVSCTKEFGDKPTTRVEPVALPNPTTRSTTITNGAWEKGTPVMVCNMRGEVVMTCKADDFGYVDLELEGLSQGLYLVKIGEEVIKVVKQ